MRDLQEILDISSRDHDHLCPRQILGARIGLAGLCALGYSDPPARKQVLVILETDGCFADGVMAATGCSVGHRTLRIQDYGKTAATFIDTQTGRALRVAPAIDARERAQQCVPEEPRHYFAQMEAYRRLPADKLLTFTEVQLTTPVDQIVSRPGIRVNCEICGEEIINERETERDGLVVCLACVGDGYYRDAIVPSLTDRRSQQNVQREMSPAPAGRAC